MTPIADVIQRLDRMRELQIEIRAIKERQARLPELEREFEAMRTGLVETLEAIDVLQRGNFGWEGRTVAFLAQMHEASGAGYHRALQPSTKIDPPDEIRRGSR